MVGRGHGGGGVIRDASSVVARYARLSRPYAQQRRERRGRRCAMLGHADERFVGPRSALERFVTCLAKVCSHFVIPPALSAGLAVYVARTNPPLVCCSLEDNQSNAKRYR